MKILNRLIFGVLTCFGRENKLFEAEKIKLNFGLKDLEQ